MSPRSPAIGCPACGAPLKWKGVAPVVECRHCGTHVDTSSWRTTEEPATVRSSASQSTATVLVVVAVMVLSLGGTGVAAFLSQGATGSGVSFPGQNRVPEATVMASSLTVSRAVLARTLGVDDPGEGDLTVWLKGGTMDYAIFRWERDEPEHPASFGFYRSGDHPHAEAVHGWLRHYLGPRFKASDDGKTWSWHWQGASLHASTSLEHMGGYVRPDDDPHWQYRLQLLWSVAVASMQGVDMELGSDVTGPWLAHGLPLSRIAELDPLITVGKAPKAVPARLAGAGVRLGGDLSFEVPVDHPWFNKATLSWPNKEGSAMSDSRLWGPESGSEFTDQEAIRRCLDAAFGEGSVQQMDYLKGTWRATWDLPGLDSVDLYPNNLTMRLARWKQQPTSKSVRSWRQVLQALGRCG